MAKRLNILKPPTTDGVETSANGKFVVYLCIFLVWGFVISYPFSGVGSEDFFSQTNSDFSVSYLKNSCVMKAQDSHSVHSLQLNK